MKKLISTLAILTMISTFTIAQEVQNDISEVDVDVDVIVEAEDAVVTITTDEILDVVAQKLNKNTRLNEEQKKKILEMVQQKLQNKEVPQIQLCVEICKEAEVKWRKGCDLDTCKKDIENIEKRIKENIEEAQKRIEKTFRKREHLRAHLQQAKEVLQKLIENGIPVQHAIDVVTSVPFKKENVDISYEVKVKLEEKLNKGEALIPAVLPQELQNKLQLRIKESLEEQSQLQYQKQQSFEIQTQQQIQNVGDASQTAVEQQLYLGADLQIQNPANTIPMQYEQMINEYQQMKGEMNKK